jgi:phage terminase large subunit-like protein
VVLLEKTANGPALYTDLKKLNPRFEIKLVPVAKLSKAERLETHRFKILKRRISLPSDAIWRAPFIDEIIGFPGEFDDQVDAMTQYLDFMGTKPIIKRMPPREHGIAIVTGSSMLRQR